MTRFNKMEDARRPPPERLPRLEVVGQGVRVRRRVSAPPLPKATHHYPSRHPPVHFRNHRTSEKPALERVSFFSDWSDATTTSSSPSSTTPPSDAKEDSAYLSELLSEDCKAVVVSLPHPPTPYTPCRSETGGWIHGLEDARDIKRVRNEQLNYSYESSSESEYPSSTDPTVGHTTGSSEDTLSDGGGTFLSESINCGYTASSLSSSERDDGYAFSQYYGDSMPNIYDENLTKVFRGETFEISEKDSFHMNRNQHLKDSEKNHTHSSATFIFDESYTYSKTGRAQFFPGSPGGDQVSIEFGNIDIHLTLNTEENCDSKPWPNTNCKPKENVYSKTSNSTAASYSIRSETVVLEKSAFESNSNMPDISDTQPGSSNSANNINTSEKGPTDQHSPKASSQAVPMTTRHQETLPLVTVTSSGNDSTKVKDVRSLIHTDSVQFLSVQDSIQQVNRIQELDALSDVRATTALRHKAKNIKATVTRDDGQFVTSQRSALRHDALTTVGRHDHQTVGQQQPGVGSTYRERNSTFVISSLKQTTFETTGNNSGTPHQDVEPIPVKNMDFYREEPPVRPSTSTHAFFDQDIPASPAQSPNVMDTINTNNNSVIRRPQPDGAEDTIAPPAPNVVPPAPNVVPSAPTVAPPAPPSAAVTTRRNDATESPLSPGMSATLGSMSHQADGLQVMPLTSASPFNNIAIHEPPPDDLEMNYEDLEMEVSRPSPPSQSLEGGDVIGEEIFDDKEDSEESDSVAESPLPLSPIPPSVNENTNQQRNGSFFLDSLCACIENTITMNIFPTELQTISSEVVSEAIEKAKANTDNLPVTFSGDFSKPLDRDSAVATASPPPSEPEVGGGMGAKVGTGLSNDKSDGGNQYDYEDDFEDEDEDDGKTAKTCTQPGGPRVGSSVRGGGKGVSRMDNTEEKVENIRLKLASTKLDNVSRTKTGRDSASPCPTGRLSSRNDQAKLAYGVGRPKQKKNMLSKGESKTSTTTAKRTPRDEQVRSGAAGRLGVRTPTRANQSLQRGAAIYGTTTREGRRAKAVGSLSTIKRDPATSDRMSPHPPRLPKLPPVEKQSSSSAESKKSSNTVPTFGPKQTIRALGAGARNLRDMEKRTLNHEEGRQDRVKASTPRSYNRSSTKAYGRAGQFGATGGHMARRVAAPGDNSSRRGIHQTDTISSRITSRVAPINTTLTSSNARCRPQNNLTSTIPTVLKSDAYWQNGQLHIRIHGPTRLLLPDTETAGQPAPAALKEGEVAAPSVPLDVRITLVRDNKRAGLAGYTGPLESRPGGMRRGSGVGPGGGGAPGRNILDTRSAHSQFRTNMARVTAMPRGKLRPLERASGVTMTTGGGRQDGVSTDLRSGSSPKL